MHMRFCYLAIKAHVAFTFLCFFSQDVTFETLLVSYLTSSRYFEAFFGTGIRFYFRHFTLVFECTLEAFPTGGSLSNLFRIMLPPGHSLWKRGAKIRQLQLVSKTEAHNQWFLTGLYPLPTRSLSGFQGPPAGSRMESGKEIDGKRLPNSLPSGTIFQIKFKIILVILWDPVLYLSWKLYLVNGTCSWRQKFQLPQPLPPT